VVSGERDPGNLRAASELPGEAGFCDESLVRGAVIRQQRFLPENTASCAGRNGDYGSPEDLGNHPGTYF